MREGLLVACEVVVVGSRVYPEGIARTPCVGEPRLTEVVIARPFPRGAIAVGIDVVHQLGDAAREAPVHADDGILERLGVGLAERRAAFRRIPRVSGHVVGGCHRKVVVHFVADEQVLVLRPVHGRGRQHHVRYRRGHAGLSFHLHAQHVVVFPHPGPQGGDLFLQPDIAADRVQVIAHARRAAVAEAENVLEKRWQVRDQRVLAAAAELLGHLVRPELVRTAAVAGMRVVEQVPAVGLQ